MYKLTRSLIIYITFVIYMHTQNHWTRFQYHSHQTDSNTYWTEFSGLMGTIGVFVVLVVSTVVGVAPIIAAAAMASIALLCFSICRFK